MRPYPGEVGRALHEIGGVYPDRTLDGMRSRTRTMMTLGTFLSLPAVVDGALSIGSTDGNVYALG